jgi:hypothetical protein
MGLLSFFSKSSPVLHRLPAGSMTVDAKGNVVTTTVSSSYPQELLRDIGAGVMQLFQEARAAQMPMSQLNIHFASLQINARELHGGAIIFLSPKTNSSKMPVTN